MINVLYIFTFYLAPPKLSITTITIEIINVGDRPIQVGSHFHFAEVNAFLKFDREKAKGTRLNIASGTSIRFEPGQKKIVDLVYYKGKKNILGFNNYN